jgi:hypothetical protein
VRETLLLDLVPLLSAQYRELRLLNPSMCRGDNPARRQARQISPKELFPVFVFVGPHRDTKCPFSEPIDNALAFTNITGLKWWDCPDSSNSFALGKVRT